MAEVAIDDPNLELFERWRSRGDTDALARVFDATAARLLALAVHLAGNVPDAEDLVQQTFLTAIERSSSFDRTRSLEPWLAGILSNHARELRRSAERSEQVARGPEREPATPVDEAEESESKAVVAAAVDKLEEPYRSVLILAVRHGMSPAEIAYALQRSPGAVRVQLHRGRELLRRLLPVGMVASLLLARGLAEVRASVLARAEVLGAALRAGSIAGGVLVGKKLVAALAVFVVALLVVLELREGNGLGPPERESSTPVVATLESSPEQAPTPALAQAPEGRSRTELSSSPASEPRTVRLHGRVVDAESGAGIAGADVSLYAPHRAKLSEVKRRWSDRSQLDPFGRIHGLPWPRFGGSPDPSGLPDGELSERALLDGEEVEVYEPPDPGVAAIARVRSDPEGLFEIAAPEALGFLMCDAAGYALRERALSPNELNRTHAGELAITVAMRAPRQLSGYIVGKDAQRIARSVRLAFFGHLSKSSFDSIGPDGRPRARDPDPELRRQCDQWLVETNADGSFECELPAQMVLAECLDPEFTVVRSWLAASAGTAPTEKAWLETGSTDTFAIELGPASSIRVRDRETRAPIEYLHLLCKTVSAGADLRRGTYFARDGRLRLSGPDVGKSGTISLEKDLAECLCTVWAEGYLPLTLRLPNLTDGYVVEFDLQRGAAPSIEGVVRAGDRPVPNASITLFEHGPGPWTQSIWEGIGTTKTDPSGRFRIEAPAARYRMQVLAGESEEWRAVELPCITPIEFDLSQDTRLVVGVHDAAGVSCPGLPMLLQCVDGRWLSSRTDDNGSACFSHLPAGTQRLLLAETKAGDPQHGDHVLEVELLAGRERRVEMTVSGAARCARLSVEGLAALADWHACVPNGSERRFGSTVDVDGRIPIDIRDCPLLAIESPDHRQWEFLLPRDAPDGYAVHIVPDGPGYEGTLCSLVDGKALTNLRVIAVPLDRAGQAGTIGIGVTDAQGRFRLTGLEEKQYGLWFESPSGSQEYARTRVHPREGPASPATQLALAIPRQIGQGFEGLDSITIRGVVRRASDRSLPQRGAIWSELEKPGYLLRANVPFAVRADGSYEVHAPAALRYTASFGSTGTGSEPEVTWSATSTGDIEVHDFELP